MFSINKECFNTVIVSAFLELFSEQERNININEMNRIFG